MQTLSAKPERCARRGMAMVTTLLVLMGVMAVALLGVIAKTGSAQVGGKNGLLSATGNTMQMSAARTVQISAFNIAESGVVFTIQWMHHLGGPPAMTQSFPLPRWDQTPGAAQYTYPMGGGTFRVTIYPDSGNQTAAVNGSVLKKYMIESVGTCAGAGTLGTVTQIVRAYVQERSFGKYAFFTDNDPNNIYWVGGRHTFDGPVHSNNSDGQNTNIIWVDNQPIYNDQSTEAYTFSGGVNWIHNGSLTAPNASQWGSVASFGQTGVHQSDNVPMPVASTLQQYAAMGQTPPANGTGTPGSAPSGSNPAVVAPNGGGLYVHGAVSQMVLGVNSFGQQTMTITQTATDGKPYVSMVTMSSSGTQVQSAKFTSSPPDTVAYSNIDWSSYTTSTANTKSNGVVYCDAGIGNQSAILPSIGAGQGLSGTVADYQGLTIATSSAYDINVNGNVVYKTPRAKGSDGLPLPETDPSNATFVQRAGTLGIVASAVHLVDNDANGNALGDVEMDAVMMAYDTVTAQDYGLRTPHKFICMGGEIAGVRGALGTFNSSTLLMNSGYEGHYSYDGRMANTPPPFFPTTSTQYDTLSWQRVSATL